MIKKAVVTQQLLVIFLLYNDPTNAKETVMSYRIETKTFLVMHQHPENKLKERKISPLTLSTAISTSMQGGNIPQDIKMDDVRRAIWSQDATYNTYTILRTLIRGHVYTMCLYHDERLCEDTIDYVRMSWQPSFWPSPAQRIADIHTNLDEVVHQRVVATARHDGFLPPELRGIKTFYSSSNWKLSKINGGTITLIGPMDGVMVEWTLGLQPNQKGHYESFTIVPRPSLVHRLVRRLRRWLYKSEDSGTAAIVNNVTTTD